MIQKYNLYLYLPITVKKYFNIKKKLNTSEKLKIYLKIQLQLINK